jgi:hypothetical protein
MALRADLITVVTNRLTAQGFVPTAEQVLSLVDDIESTVNTDSGVATSQAATDTTAFPAPPEND